MLHLKWKSEQAFQFPDNFKTYSRSQRNTTPRKLRKLCKYDSNEEPQKDGRNMWAIKYRTWKYNLEWDKKESDKPKQRVSTWMKKVINFNGVLQNNVLKHHFKYITNKNSIFDKLKRFSMVFDITSFENISFSWCEWNVKQIVSYAT